MEEKKVANVVSLILHKFCICLAVLYVMPSLARWWRAGIVPLCAVWLHLKHCMQVWAPQRKKDIKLLKSVY